MYEFERKNKKVVNLTNNNIRNTQQLTRSQRKVSDQYSKSSGRMLWSVCKRYQCLPSRILPSHCTIKQIDLHKYCKSAIWMPTIKQIIGPVHGKLSNPTINRSNAYSWCQYRTYGRSTSHIVPNNKFLGTKWFAYHFFTMTNYSATNHQDINSLSTCRFPSVFTWVGRLCNFPTSLKRKAVTPLVAYLWLALCLITSPFCISGLWCSSCLSMKLGWTPWAMSADTAHQSNFISIT